MSIKAALGARGVLSRLLLVAFMAAGAPVRAVSAGEDLVWGANGHPLSAYGGVSIETQMQLMKDIGLTYYRVDVRSAADGDGLARVVEAGKRYGIKILPVITPTFDLAKETPQDLYRKAHALARELVTPLKGDVRVWELGNEMENFAIIRACEMQDDGVQYNCSWGPAGGTRVLDYYGPRWMKVSAVLKGLSEGVISVDPRIRKAIGTAGWGHTGAFLRMQQDGIPWDISVWHTYTTEFAEAMKFLSGFSKPIWVTEFNHSGGSLKGEADQSNGLVRIVRRLRELKQEFNIEAAFVYELLDEPYWTSYEGVMGLARLEKQDERKWRIGEPKQAYFALQSMIQNPFRDSAAAPAVRSTVQMTPERRVSTMSDLRRGCRLEQFHQFDTSARNQVAYSYCLALDRAPDGGGIAGWLQALGSEIAPERMLVLMIGSVEFAQRYNTKALDNAAFVVLLYRLLLDREPDGAELFADAAKFHAGTSRMEFAQSLIKSGEFQSLHHIFFPARAGVATRQ